VAVIIQDDSAIDLQKYTAVVSYINTYYEHGFTLPPITRFGPGDTVNVYNLDTTHSLKEIVRTKWTSFKAFDTFFDMRGLTLRPVGYLKMIGLTEEHSMSVRKGQPKVACISEQELAIIPAGFNPKSGSVLRVHRD
jgi:hypothetical protein